MIKLKHLLPECNECGRNWNHGHDHEAGMAKNELRDAISNASKIDQMIGEGDNLPGWVSAYISLAADYMHSVAEYLAGESSRMQEPGPGYNEALNEGIDLRKVQSADDAVRNLLRNISTNSNIPTAEKIGILEALKELQQFVDEVGYEVEIEDEEEYVSDYAKRRAQEKNLEEKKKPSAGLTKKEKSAVAKKAHAGKDIGKKGPGFEKVAKAAEKKYGSKEAGEKVAAAAMWKNVKR